MTRRCIHPSLVTLHQLTIQALRKHVHLGVLELPRADFLLEQHIHLGERAASRLWNTEIRVDDTKEADTTPEETGEVTPVPGAGVKHVGGEDGTDDTNHNAVRDVRSDTRSEVGNMGLLKHPTESNSLDLEFASRHLTNKRVANSSNGKLVR